VTGADAIFEPPLNFLGLEGKEASRGFARFVLLPVPHEASVVGQPGARFGPEAILRASRQLERFDEELNLEPENFGIHTLASLRPAAEGPTVMMTRVKTTVASVLAEEKVPVVIGGDHSVTTAAVEACMEQVTPRLTVLQIDAHADLDGPPASQAPGATDAMRPLLGRVRLVQVGIRSLSSADKAAMGQGQVHTFFMHAIRRRQISDIITEITQAARGNLYITIDLSGLDPSVMPATARPRPGGLLWWELLAILRSVISQSTVVGFDVVELAPIPGLVAPDTLAAQLVLKLIGYTAKYQAHWRRGAAADAPGSQPAAGGEPGQVPRV
jgi:agmatinase